MLVNRVLFPGGGSSLAESAYLEAAETIFTLAKQVRGEKEEGSERQGDVILRQNQS